MVRSRILDTLASAGRYAVLGAALSVAATPALAVQEGQDGQEAPSTAVLREPAGAPVVTRAAYNSKKGALLIIGDGFDETATVRVNGVEIDGERKFRADKRKLRIKIPASSLALKADGQNTVEILQGSASSGEISF